MTENLIYLIYFFSGVSVILLVMVVRLEFRLRRMMRGNKVDNFEDAMVSAIKDIEKLYIMKERISEEIAEMKERAKKNLKTAKTIRFNPFSDTGTSQSFATALIDDNGDGVVLSSIYSRDRMSVYAKPLKACQSEYELSPEEKEAIRRARVCE